MGAFLYFPLPATLTLFLLFQLSSSSSSCHLLSDSFCSLLDGENITLCPATVNSINSSWPPGLSQDRNTSNRAELLEKGSKGARTVRIWDSSLGRRSRPLNYDFLYKFVNPVTDLNTLRLQPENQSTMDCNLSKKDFFSKLANLPPSVKYDIYYSIFSADGVPLNRSSSCSEQIEDAAAWDLLLSPTSNSSVGNCYDAALLGLGYMHGRKFDLQCLSCQIAPNANSTFQKGDSAVCTCGSSTTSSSGNGNGKKSNKGEHWKRDGSAITAAGFLAILLIFLICGQRRSKEEIEESKIIETFLERYISSALIRFKYSELKNISKSFSEKIGEGGFAQVFKGKLRDGQIVAIKLLNESSTSAQEFMNEVASIGRINHVNVVGLIGFCLEGQKMALIYEFMPNGSLEKFLSDKSLHAGKSLQWEDVYNIALGIARGLEYLHKGCNTGVVHFDIKPHNILLDENFHPKISDFGLSKLCASKDSVLSITIPRGTVGYIAPEVISRTFGAVSSKADVYSYGMLILEMIGGRYSEYVKTQNNETSAYFPEWIYEQFDKSGNLHIDTVTNFEHDREIVMKMVKIGLWCIQTYPTERPPISKVVQMLNAKSEEFIVPPKPYICSLAGSSKDWESSSSSMF